MSTGIVEKLGRELEESATWKVFSSTWPDWEIRFWHVPGGGESVDWGDRIVWFDISCPDPEWWAAHAAFHLMLHGWSRRPGEPFSAVEEAEANRLADHWVATVRRHRRAG